MKKIVVAGAGHGGLVSAIRLSQNGYDVTVIEKQKRADMGHDWHDWIYMEAFDGSGIPRPAENLYFTAEDQCFRNPKGNRRINMPHNEGSYMMDRRLLIHYLLSLADEAGVHLQFETEIVAPITEGRVVKGVIIKKDGALETVQSDLLIDSAGMYSPVRSKLPAVFGIDNEINKRSIFHVYRAYFKNTTGEKRNPAYEINLFHMYRPGIDWVITEKDYVDILIGKFSQAGVLTAQEVEDAISAFKKDYPFIGDEIVRGGSFEDLPISRMLPLIVADGYAAVGDSAGMTVPLNGSGIVLSMNAGKILADTVMKISGKITKSALWEYEYEYFTKHAKDLVMIDIIKTIFTYVKGDVVDYLLEKEILTADLIGVADGKPLELKPDYILHVLSASLPLLKLIPAVAKCLKTIPFVPIICNKIPKNYDEKKVNNWIRAYRAL